MDNQHRKIKGYRELSQAEIDLMNEIKTKGVELGELVVKLQGHLLDQRRGPLDQADIQHFMDAEPEVWLCRGEQHLQEGLMALTRAVAQPEFF